MASEIEQLPDLAGYLKLASHREWLQVALSRPTPARSAGRAPARSAGVSGAALAAAEIVTGTRPEIVDGTHPGLGME
jgi:hypothetical protein